MPTYTYSPAPVLIETSGEFAIGATGVLRATEAGPAVAITDLNDSPLATIVVGAKGAHQAFKADIPFGFLDFGSVLLPVVSLQQQSAALTAVTTANDALAASNTASTNATSALATVTATASRVRTRLRKRKQYLARQEGVAVAANGTLTLASLTGQGTVSRIWLAIESFGPASPLDSRLEVLVDGASTPDISIDLGTLFCSHYFGASGAPLPFRIGCQAMSSEVGAAINTTGGYALNFDMPYRNGIVIRLVNGNAGGNVFSQIVYDQETPEALVLKSSGVTYANKATMAIGDTRTLLSVPAGKAGWVVWQSIVGATIGSTNGAWLERDIEIKVDQESSASWMSTGLEDWFLGAWYFQNSERVSYPWSVVGANYQGKVAMGLDLRGAYGGLRFDNGIQMVLGTEAAVTVSHEMSYVTLYYQEV